MTKKNDSTTQSDAMLLIYKLATVIFKSYQFVVIAVLTRVFDCADSVSFEHHWLVSILK